MTFAGIVKSGGAATLLVILALGLAGCGRRGDLETPGTPSAKATSGSGTVIGNASGPSKANTKPIAPKRDFLLDPLL